MDYLGTRQGVCAGGASGLSPCFLLWSDSQGPIPIFCHMQQTLERSVRGKRNFWKIEKSHILK